MPFVAATCLPCSGSRAEKLKCGETPATHFHNSHTINVTINWGLEQCAVVCAACQAFTYNTRLFHPCLCVSDAMLLSEMNAPTQIKKRRHCARTPAEWKSCRWTKMSNDTQFGVCLLLVLLFVWKTFASKSIINAAAAFPLWNYFVMSMTLRMTFTAEKRRRGS